MASLHFSAPALAPDHMGSVEVKICGIMQPEHAVVAAQSGASMIGLVFAASRRQVSLEVAQAISTALAGLSRRPQLVGVFVNATTEGMLEIAACVGLDVLQLSGDETPMQVAECAACYPVLKAFRFSKDLGYDQAAHAIEPYLLPGVSILLDTYSTSEYGGTGERGNWSLARELARNSPVILAGGLTPSNVGEAISIVAPSGADVSSGVERDGVKSSILIREFIQAARSSATGAGAQPMTGLQGCPLASLHF